MESLRSQTYPLNLMEIIVADGGSNDGTIAIIQEFFREHNDLKITIISNPKRIIPSAINLGIQASHGEIIVRMDAHSYPHNDYIERCVEILEDGLADNVGGIWEIQPGDDTWDLDLATRWASCCPAISINICMASSAFSARCTFIPFSSTFFLNCCT